MIYNRNSPGVYILSLLTEGYPKKRFSYVLKSGMTLEAIKDLEIRKNDKREGEEFC